MKLTEICPAVSEKSFKDRRTDDGGFPRSPASLSTRRLHFQELYLKAWQISVAKCVCVIIFLSIHCASKTIYEVKRRKYQICEWSVGAFRGYVNTERSNSVEC